MSERKLSYMNKKQNDHMINLELQCLRMRTDLIKGISSKQAKEILKEEGRNEIIRPGDERRERHNSNCSDGDGGKKKFFGIFASKKSSDNTDGGDYSDTSDMWSKKEWNKLFNACTDQNVMVVRDGRRKLVNGVKLVTGDVVILAAPQQIPADCRVISSGPGGDMSSTTVNKPALVVDNRIINGNSSEIKSPRVTSDDPLLTENLVFAGTRILSGCLVGLVLRKGMDTVYGNLTQYARKVTYERRHSRRQSSPVNTKSVIHRPVSAMASLPAGGIKHPLARIRSNTSASAASKWMSASLTDSLDSSSMEGSVTDSMTDGISDVNDGMTDISTSLSSGEDSRDIYSDPFDA